jgi:predicted O-methyltransferase YrrM
MTTTVSDEFLRRMSCSWRINQAVRWNNVPDFQPTSTANESLKFMCRFGGYNRALFEFGTWIGRSTLGFAQNFGRVVTIDFAPASDIKYNYKGHRSGELVEGWSNVERIQADSLEYDFTHFKGSFDVVYVDGNHTAVGAAKDLETSKFILRNGGLIFVDDYNNPTMGVTDAVNQADFSQKFWLEDIRQVVLLR